MRYCLCRLLVTCLIQNKLVPALPGLRAAVANLVLFHRAQFVPQMVNSLTKLGMAQGGSNLENRTLAIDLCGVMVLWEERRIKELQAGPRQVLYLLSEMCNAFVGSYQSDSGLQNGCSLSMPCSYVPIQSACCCMRK